MSHVKKNLTNVVASIIGVILIVAIAVWQFYLFVTFKNSNGIVDLQGGTHHLWWAILMTVLACVVGFAVFSIFLRYDRDDEMHITS